MEVYKCDVYYEELVTHFPQKGLVLHCLIPCLESLKYNWLLCLPVSFFTFFLSLCLLLSFFVVLRFYWVIWTHTDGLTLFTETFNETPGTTFTDFSYQGSLLFWEVDSTECTGIITRKLINRHIPILESNKIYIFSFLPISDLIVFYKP